MAKAKTKKTTTPKVHINTWRAALKNVGIDRDEYATGTDRKVPGAPGLRYHLLWVNTSGITNVDSGGTVMHDSEQYDGMCEFLDLDAGAMIEFRDQLRAGTSYFVTVLCIVYRLEVNADGLAWPEILGRSEQDKIETTIHPRRHCQTNPDQDCYCDLDDLVSSAVHDARSTALQRVYKLQADLDESQHRIRAELAQAKGELRQYPADVK